MTGDELRDVHGVPVLLCAPTGPVLHGDAEVLDVIGAALQEGAEVVAVPVERLPAEFFTLRSGHTGQLTQKLVNYRLRLAVVGDITAHLSRSPTLRDFVAEANRGPQTWFVATQDELADRLRQQGR